MSDSAISWTVWLLCPRDSPGKDGGVGCHLFPPLGDLPAPGIESASPALQVDSLYPEPLGGCIVKAVTDEIRRRKLYSPLDLSRLCTLELPSGTHKIQTHN